METLLLFCGLPIEEHLANLDPIYGQSWAML
jgi:hypothetical protein